PRPGSPGPAAAGGRRRPPRRPPRPTRPCTPAGASPTPAAPGGPAAAPARRARTSPPAPPGRRRRTARAGTPAGTRRTGCAASTTPPRPAPPPSTPHRRTPHLRPHPRTPGRKRPPAGSSPHRRVNKPPRRPDYWPGALDPGDQATERRLLRQDEVELLEHVTAWARHDVRDECPGEVGLGRALDLGDWVVGDGVELVWDRDRLQVGGHRWRDVGRVDDRGVGLAEPHLGDNLLDVLLFALDVRGHLRLEVGAEAGILGHLRQRVLGVLPDRHVLDRGDQLEAGPGEVLELVHLTGVVLR